MSNAEAILTPTPPAPSMAATLEAVPLMGLPWRLAAALLALAPLTLLMGLSGAFTPAWQQALPWIALGLTGAGALLALLAGPRQMAELLASPEFAAPEPAGPAMAGADGPPSALPEALPDGADAGAILTALRQLLQEQQLRVTESAATVGRAVTAGAQLASLARSAETQLRGVLEQPVTPALAQIEAAAARLETGVNEAADRLSGLAETLPAEALAGLSGAAEQWQPALQQLERLEKLEALARIDDIAGRLEAHDASLGGLAALPGQMAGETARLAEATAQLDRASEALQVVPGAIAALTEGLGAINGAAEGLAHAGAALGDLPQSATELLAATRAMTERAGATQLQGARLNQLAERAEQAVSEASRRMAEMAGMAPLQELEAAVAALGRHVERVGRGEASLGDAAQYLTATTDRFAAGMGNMEQMAVRLQAMISILGQREGEAAEAPLGEALEALQQQIQAAARLGDALDTTHQHLVETLASAEVAASVPQPARGSAAGQVLDSLQQSGPANGHDPAVVMALQRLGGIEQASAELLAQAEALARQLRAEAGQGGEGLLSSHAPALRQAMQDSITRLNAAAEALVVPPAA